MKTIKKICSYCNKEFEVGTNRKKVKYCSTICYNKDRKGKKRSKLSNEAKEQISKKQKERYANGFKNWNTGKTKETDSRLAENGKKISNSLKRNFANGYTHPLQGKHHSEETIEKMRDSREKVLKRGWKSWNEGLTKESDEKLREASENMTKNWLSEKRIKSLSHYSSRLEDVFANILIEIDVIYTRQKRVAGRVFDFYLPKQKILIEVDGDWYHCNPKFYTEAVHEMQSKNILNDQLKNKIAKNNGFKLIRFWEDDIKNNSKLVKNKLLEELI